MDPSTETRPQLTLQFGLHPPANAIRAYGMRAIFGGDRRIDRLGDRQSHNPYRDEDSDPEANDALFAWLKDVGVPWLREHVVRVWFGGDYERAAHVDGRYAIVACTNGHSGYLYVVAYEVAEGDVPVEVDTPTPPPLPPRMSASVHAYQEMPDWYQKRKPCKCGEYKSDPIHRVKSGRR